MGKFAPMIANLHEYQPNFARPMTPELSVNLRLKFVEYTTLKKDGGSFVSQFGNREWL